MGQRQAQRSCMGRSSKSPWMFLWIILWSTIWWVPWTAGSWKFYMPVIIVAALLWFLVSRYGWSRRNPQVIYTPQPQQPVYYQPPELPSYREGYQEQRQFVADNEPSYSARQEEAPLQWDDEQPQAQYPEMKQPPQ